MRSLITIGLVGTFAGFTYLMLKHQKRSKTGVKSFPFSIDTYPNPEY